MKLKVQIQKQGLKEAFIKDNGTLEIPEHLVPFIGFVKEPVEKECLQCGKLFLSEHGNQKFCPPVNTKRSRCENTYNMRLKRKRKKERENQVRGVKR